MLLVSLLTMGLATFCVGLLPGYQTIGVLAPILPRHRGRKSLFSPPVIGTPEKPGGQPEACSSNATIVSIRKLMFPMCV
jgi:hypothetical protein